MRSLKTALATVFVPGTACFIVPYLILREAHASLTPPFGPVQLASIVVAGFGIYMIVWVSQTFVRQGEGTPIPIEPPTRLVASGLYRSVRNPMYVGALLVILAETAYFASPWLLVYAVGLWAILHTFLVVMEEPQLKKRFGADYEKYLKTVPRWIPRWPGAHGPAL